MCLLLGPSNVGKSLLLEKLGDECAHSKSKSYENISLKPSIKRIVFSCGKRTEIGIIEPENCSFSCWAKYLVPQCSSILFMIDSTNRRQISEAYILLLKVLSFPETNNVPVLILLNKCDKGDSMTRTEVEVYFHLKDIVNSFAAVRKQSNITTLNSSLCANERSSESMVPDVSSKAPRQINVLECSCTDGTGLPFILSWLQQNVGQ